MQNVQIEDYLLGHLSQEEELQFESELKESSELAHELEFQKKLISAIQLARKKDLKNSLRRQLGQKKKNNTYTNPVPMWAIAALFLTVVISTSLYFFIDRNKKPAAKQAFNQPAQNIPPVNNRQIITPGPDTINTDVKKVTVKPLVTTGIQKQVKDTPDDLKFESINTDIMISDTLLAYLHPVPRHDTGIAQPADNTEVKSTTKEVAREADQGDNLEFAAVQGAPKVKVEYWVSPVNFRGYLYFRNRLVLYGLEHDPNIKIVQHNQKIYLVHNEEIYRLKEQNDYNSFVKEEDPAVLEKPGK